MTQHILLLLLHIVMPYMLVWMSVNAYKWLGANQILWHSLSTAVVLRVKYPLAISNAVQHFGRIWKQIVNKMSTYLANPKGNLIFGTFLVCLHLGHRFRITPKLISFSDHFLPNCFRYLVMYTVHSSGLAVSYLSYSKYSNVMYWSGGLA